MVETKFSNKNRLFIILIRKCIDNANIYLNEVKFSDYYYSKYSTYILHCLNAAILRYKTYKSNI